MLDTIDFLLFGVLWWDSYCVINLVGGHYALPVTEEAFNYYNWHNHMANILTLRENLIDTLNAQLDKEVYVIADLESSIIEEQKADIAEQKTKLIKQIVYPTVIVVGLKLAWSLGCWLLPKAVAVVA
jgi:hypothetical protein